MLSAVNLVILVLQDTGAVPHTLHNSLTSMTSDSMQCLTQHLQKMHLKKVYILFHLAHSICKTQ